MDEIIPCDRCVDVHDGNERRVAGGRAGSVAAPSCLGDALPHESLCALGLDVVFRILYATVLLFLFGFVTWLMLCFRLLLRDLSPRFEP